MMVEELAYGDCAIANQIGGISFPYVAKLLQFGTDKQKEQFLRPVVEGKYYIALLLSEPHAGSDALAAKTWMDGHGRDTHPRHIYAPEDYGITAEGLLRAFDFYHTTFLRAA